jgi:flavin-dependent dehydrogenase
LERCEVLVVGAGLAGLEVARLLAHRGLDVLLVDRRRRLSSGVATTGIFVRRTLETFSLPEDCLGPPVRHVTLVSPSGRRLDLASDVDEFRVGLMGELYERWLAAATAEGARWAPGTSLEALRPTAAGTEARLRHGDERRDVTARFVIGADGCRSTVARGLGLDRNRQEIVGAEVVYRGVPLTGPPRFVCVLDPRLAPGYLAWIVQDGVETHVGVGGYARRYAVREALEEFLRQAGRFVDLEAGEAVERRGGRIPVGGVLPRIANRHGLLVGDAAGAVSPLTAGGLDPCLRLSALATELTSRYLATGDERVLAPYDGRWFRRRFRSRLVLRRALVMLETPQLVEIGCTLLRTPPGEALAHKIFFGRGSFPDHPLAPQAVSIRAARSE